MLNCIDNSGASLVECVANLRMKRHAKIGDRIIVVIQKTHQIKQTLGGTSQGVSAINRVKRGDIRHAVVVRTRKKLQRPDGSVIRFDDNACALIGKNGEPIGTRINGESGLTSWTAMSKLSLTGRKRGCWCRIKTQAMVEDTISSFKSCINVTSPSLYCKGPPKTTLCWVSLTAYTYNTSLHAKFLFLLHLKGPNHACTPSFSRAFLEYMTAGNANIEQFLYHRSQ